jgi:hypothetical protein
MLQDIERLGKAGYRTLGVAVSDENGSLFISFFFLFSEK